MNFTRFIGQGNRKAPGGDPPPGRPSVHDIDPASYVSDTGLAAAVNVALALDQPLLLTGEPGTGKTQLAYRVAWELDLVAPLKFETKSTSLARELFYTYDALRHFQSPGGQASDPRAFVELGPLGTAVALASDEAGTRRLLDPERAAAAPSRSVVLIDEIDKAPRDFPNDILNEIDVFAFSIPELKVREAKAPRERRPFVVITSNSEKDLPDAFLRRCVFYHIEFPEPVALRQIVEGRLGAFIANDDFLRQVIALFYALRAGQLRKPPATAELLGWIIALRQASPDGSNPLSDHALIDRTLSAVIKTVDDKDEARRLVAEWLKKRA